MSLLNRLERTLGRFAIPNLSLYLVIGQILFLGLAMFAQFDLERISLLPNAVKEGEVWRLITYLVVPPAGALTMLRAIFLAFSLYMFYLMGSALEHSWGEFRFNAYLIIGWALTTAGAFISPGVYSTNTYILLSVFLAFAWLNPDFEISIYGIIPVKMKWLALIQWLYYGFLLVVGSWPVRVMILASISNFLVFFASDLVRWLRSGRRRITQQTRQVSAPKDEDEPRHRCHKCGKTDLTHPQVEFRYCSKCAGEECYCREHLGNHEHTVVEAKKS